MAAKVSGLVQVADDVYLTEPTRSHVVLVQAEGSGWSAWAGRYREHAGELRLTQEWTMYVGPDAARAFNAAERFARRLVS